MERRVERMRDLVSRLHAHPRRRLTLLVGVDGPAGGAQAAFTRALSALDAEMAVVPLADFALPEPAEDGGQVDWRRLRSQVLLPLGRDVAARYDRAGSGVREVGVGGIVVVAGFRACMRQLATFYDFRVWVEAGAGARVEPAADDAPHLLVDGSGTVAHDPAVEYVRLRP